MLSKLASSAMQFVFSGRNGGAMTSEQKLQNAKFEVVALDRVVRSLFLELKERRALKKRAVESRTTFGRAKNTSGVLMSVCCAVKLLSVFGQIVLGKSKKCRRRHENAPTPPPLPLGQRYRRTALSIPLPRVHRVSRGTSSQSSYSARQTKNQNTRPSRFRTIFATMLW